jgi:hypothetical protein
LGERTSSPLAHFTAAPFWKSDSNDRAFSTAALFRESGMRTHLRAQFTGARLKFFRPMK